MNELSDERQRKRVGLLKAVSDGKRRGLSERAALMEIHKQQQLHPNIDITGFAVYEDFNKFYDCYKKYKRDEERDKKQISKFPKIPHYANNPTQGMARL